MISQPHSLACIERQVGQRFVGSLVSLLLLDDMAEEIVRLWIDRHHTAEVCWLEMRLATGWHHPDGLQNLGRSAREQLGRDQIRSSKPDWLQRREVIQPNVLRPPAIHGPHGDNVIVGTH